MKKVYCIIKNLNGDILTIRNKNKYFLPTFLVESGSSKRYLTSKLYKNFGLNVKKSYLILKEEVNDNLYYLCEEPYSIDEFKIDGRKKRKLVWVPVIKLKDTLPKNDTITTKVLSKILFTKFSFSQNERNEMGKLINKAKENNDELISNYLLDKMLYLATGQQDKIDENEKKYSNELIKLLCSDLQLTFEKKLNEMDLFDLTLDEAKMAGKQKEWEEEFRKWYYYIVGILPTIPARCRINYYVEACKLENKDGITINILLDLYKRYKNKDYFEIRDDIRKRQKEKLKKEKQIKTNKKK